MCPTMNDNLPVILFKNEWEWADWLETNIDAPGVWVRIAKKGSGLISVTYPEAVDVGICYGWIDGLKKKYDEKSYIQRFTARKPKSNWSKINKEKALRFIDEGMMKPAGLATIENAKKSGAWETAYDSQTTIEVPEDFQKLLDENKTAKDFFTTLNSVNRYAILVRLQTARKQETRKRKMKEFIEMLNKKEKIY
jgi:uncharacterized protein YdeI (YjbR/CyaY-like superfamily)